LNPESASMGGITFLAVPSRNTGVVVIVFAVLVVPAARARVVLLG
jgi:hypothetical protein